MELRGGLKTSILMLAITAGLATGCGRANTVYSDSRPACSDTVSIDDGPINLPEGFADQSVDEGFIQLVNPGAADARVRLSGNRAILGLHSYDSVPLSEFDFEAQTLDQKPLTLALQIDLACDSVDVETVVIENSTTDLERTLDQILSQSPNACLRNGVPNVQGLPPFSIGAVLLMNGLPDSESAETLDIQTLKIQSETFSAWGAK